MLNKAGFLTVDASKAEQVVAECERDGWRIFRLPASVASKRDFFEAVRVTLPLDPALHSNHSWDALADSLWAGLDGLPEDKIAIVWPAASAMEKHAAKDFAIAVNILMELPGLLSNTEVTAGATKQLLVLQVI